MRPLAYSPNYALNPVCPYFTMVPLEYPLSVLKRHRKRRPVVMAACFPRRTPWFAPRSLGLKSWGIDTPVAVAKVARFLTTKHELAATLATALAEANTLSQRRRQPSVPETSEWLVINQASRWQWRRVTQGYGAVAPIPHAAKVRTAMEASE